MQHPPLSTPRSEGNHGTYERRNTASAIHADGDRRAARRRPGLVDQAGRRPAAGARLSHRGGQYLLSRRKPGGRDTLITKRVEDAVVTINDIDYISSNSTEGVSTVVIFFKDKAPKDSSIDVERKVSGIRGLLPADAKDPSVGKYDPNAQPILQLTVSGNRDLAALQRLAEDKIQKRIEGTDGVAQVSVLGGLVREIQIQVDQSKLQARGLSI